MSYQRYVAGVGRRRALLEADLVKANQLRLEANLPLWDIDKVVADQQPLLTEAEFLKRRMNAQAFSRFRQEHLVKLGPSMTSLADREGEWREHRASTYRLMFLEHQIQQAWLAQAKGTPANP